MSLTMYPSGSQKSSYPAVGLVSGITLLWLIPAIIAESHFACQSTTVVPHNGLPYYETTTQEMTYKDAELECRKKGANLPAIRDNDRRILTDPPRIWLSAKRRYWTHVSHDLGLSYESWADDEPKTTIDSCVSMVTNKTIDNLYSRPCSDILNVICMNKDLVGCYGNKQFYDNHCYFVPEEPPQNFENAFSLCSEKSAFLVDIYNQKQIEWISTNFSINHDIIIFWTGYKYNGSSTDYYWYDGSRVINANLTTRSGSRGDCVILVENGEWEEANCEDKNGFICTLEVPYVMELMTNCTNHDGECVCYWIHNEEKTFHQAMAYCLSEGGSLFYPNTEAKMTTLESLAISSPYWIGISDGHTKGVFRGSDASAITWASWNDLEPANDCVYVLNGKFQTGYWYKQMKFVCQSQPDPDLYPCQMSTGCLGAADYWDVDEPSLVYVDTSNITIRNVYSFEECWTLCINYIGFVCQIITYDKRLDECQLSNNSDDSWLQHDYLRSRNRTRRIQDPDSYCLELVHSRVQFEEAVKTCYNYKNGSWILPVIRDDVMQGKVALFNVQSWVSAKITTVNGVFVTTENEYIPYSNWAPSGPTFPNSNCVRSENETWTSTSCASESEVVCFNYLDRICRDFPMIEHGSALRTESSGDVLYTCDEQYLFLKLNATSYRLKCDCNWYTNLEVLPPCKDMYCRHDPLLENAIFIKHGNVIGSVMEIICDEGYRVSNLNTNTVNSTCVADSTATYVGWFWVPPCEAIVCPTPEDSINGTTINITGFMINDTVLYQCPYGYQVTETGLIYYNLTCNLVPGTTTAVWSEHPQLEPLNCSSKEYLISKATFIKYGTAIGSVIQVVCDEGYRICNSSTDTVNTTCVLDKFGTSADWCWVPPCEVIICPEPDVVSMANYMIFGNTVNDTVTYTCQTNYRINGTSTNIWNATCGHDENFHGIWLDIPTCEAVICPDPMRVLHASIDVSPNNTEIGATTTYQCEEHFPLFYQGHQISHTNRFNMTCEMNYTTFTGIWSNYHKCDIPRCSNPPVVEHSSYDMSTSTVNSVINYTCDTNYIIISTASRWTTSKCLMEQGQLLPHWTSVDNCTVIVCTEAPNISNARLLSSSTTIGDTAQYLCDPGYRVANVAAIVREFQISCQIEDSKTSATWSELPVCEVSFCSEPSVLINGKIEVLGYQLGDTAIYTCNSGYKILSDQVVFGMSTSLASFCVLDPIGSLIWEPVPTCISEDTPIEKRTLVRQCSAPENRKGVHILYRNTFVNSVVTFITHSGYAYGSGSRARTLICLPNHQWSTIETSPKYQTCPQVKVTGATVNKRIIAAATMVTISCKNPKAKMENGLPTTIIKCTDLGKWSYLPNSCEVNRCGPFGFIDHSTLVSYNNTVGGLAEVRCDKSYSFADGKMTNSFRCLPNLTWEPHDRCLVNTCPTLTLPQQSTASTDIVLEDTIVDIKCLSGYMFPDRSIIKQVVCNSTFYWNTTLSDCENLTCPDPPIINNCNMTTIETFYNSNITYTCKEPYRMENGDTKLTIRCQENAEWTYNSFTCDFGRCPPITEIENAEPDSRQAINGTIVMYTCNKGYIFPDGNTNMSVVCDGVTWNITETACIKIQCPDLNLTHASLVQQGHNFGDVIKFICDEGYHYDDSITGVLECQSNSEWSGNAKGCLPRDCGPPPEIKFSTRTIPLDNLYGAVVTYQCLPNFWVQPGVTNSSTFCTEFGTWSNTTGNCTIIKCPVVPVWDDMEANSTYNIVGTTINISCSVGSENTNSFLLSHCTSNGEWEPAFDGCKKTEVLRFEPDPEEAKGSRSIGLLIMICMMLVFVPLMISDVPTIMRTLRGQKISVSRMKKKYTRDATGFRKY